MIAKSEAARAQERLQNIMDQIRAYEAGDQHSLTCPYCAGVNRDGQPFCCEMFAKASIAALERIRVEDARETVERVMERHSQN